MENFPHSSGGSDLWQETYLRQSAAEAIYDDLLKPLGFMRFAPGKIREAELSSAPLAGLVKHNSKPTRSSVKKIYTTARNKLRTTLAGCAHGASHELSHCQNRVSLAGNEIQSAAYSLVNSLRAS